MLWSFFSPNFLQSKVPGWVELKKLAFIPNLQGKASYILSSYFVFDIYLHDINF